MKEINETKNWFFQKIKKTSSQANQNKRKKTPIANIRNKREVITTNSLDTRKITKEYYEETYTHNFDNPDGMDQFLEKTQSAKTSTKINR